MAALGLDVQGVDRDPVTVAVATVNLRPFPNATARLGRAEGHDPRDTEAIWLDPARRAPARGGSRGLPGKNIRLLGGHPLVAWTIQAALEAEEDLHVVVSTDSAEIAEVALR